MLRITVTVMSTNHGGETVITKTKESEGGNPAFDGREVLAIAPKLVEQIATEFNKLSNRPNRTA